LKSSYAPTISSSYWHLPGPLYGNINLFDEKIRSSHDKQGHPSQWCSQYATSRALTPTES
jgi:hypothetical protein